MDETLKDSLQQWEERLKEKKDQPRPEAIHYPWNDKMRSAMEHHRDIPIPCKVCRKKNKLSNCLLQTIPYEFMQERVHMICMICESCGSVSAPRWSRDIIWAGLKRERELNEKVEGG